MYRFCLVCVCLSWCQKLIILSLHHILHSPGGRGWTHSGMTVCPSRPGVCPGLFVHLAHFVQLLIFKHCLGMLTKKQAYPYPPPPAYPYPLPAAAGCAIQPWADSSTNWIHVLEDVLYMQDCNNCEQSILNIIVLLLCPQERYELRNIVTFVCLWLPRVKFVSCLIFGCICLC